MATLYLMEFSDVARSAEFGTSVQAPQWDSLHFIAGQELTPAASNSQSAAFNTKTRFIMLVTDTTCKYAIGTNPDATVATTRSLLPANAIVPAIGVKPGEKLGCAT